MPSLCDPSTYPDPLHICNLQCSFLIVQCYYFFIPPSFFPPPSSCMSNGSCCRSGLAPHTVKLQRPPIIIIVLPGLTIFPKCSVIHNVFYSPKHNLLTTMSSQKWHYHLHGISSAYGLFICYQLTLTVVLSLIFYVLSVLNMMVVAHCSLPSHFLIDHVDLALQMVHIVVDQHSAKQFHPSGQVDEENPMAGV